MAESLFPQIKNVVFLMLENRSLDNLLGWLYSGSSPRHVFPDSSSRSYDGLVRGRYKNPAYAGIRSRVKKYPVVPIADDQAQQRIPWYDPYEEFRVSGWKGVMNQIFGNQDEIKGLPRSGAHPRMLGFLQDYYAKYMVGWQGLDILWTYTPKQLPGINKLAHQYAVSDRWFCSVPSQTNPNRAFSLCGTSLGRESNLNHLAVEQFDIPTVFNALASAGKTWGLYYTDNWKENRSYTEYTFPRITAAKANGESGNIKQFLDRAKAGTLPDFTYLEPKWGYGKGSAYVQGTDYHPPSHVLPGDQFLRSVYTTLRKSPQWEQMLFIVTFDEHGGTYDHVGPPWSAINPDGKKGKDGFKFDLFGVRVPTLLISPFIRPGTVFRAPEGSRYPFDHTSFIKVLLLWAGIDTGTVKFGKRMPEAPTFEGVLSDNVVNGGVELAEFAEPEPVMSTGGGPAEQGDAGPAEPLNELFEDIEFVATRAIINSNDSLEGIHADLEAYKKDPDKYLLRHLEPAD